MNLKIDDLEKNDGAKKEGEGEDTERSLISRASETNVSGISIESSNLIQQSMKEALLHMI